MASYGNPFSICFNMMKLRYQSYDQSIDSLNFIVPTDEVNVFISFESVMTNLSTIQDVDNKLLLERNFPTILEAETLNLAAHYKRFFRGNGLKTNVFFYYTDLGSDEFVEFEHNDEYRSYYINKFMQNPKFQLLGHKLQETIIPTVQTICEYIPYVYFISAKNIEGSLIPWIVANERPKAKNFIISMDKFDTSYMFHEDRFCMHYIKRAKMGMQVLFQYDKFMADMFKEEHENNPNVAMFKNPAFYSLVLSSLGDKLRSIDSLKGIGCKTVAKYLQCAITAGQITKDSTSIELLKEAFPSDYLEDLIKNFNDVYLPSHFNEFTEKNVHDIMSQIVDRSDYNSLIQLNKTDYKDYPLKLEELTC